MGKNDIYMKRYLSDKRRFADLFNAVIYRGEEIFTSEEMREINGTSEVVLKEQNGKERSVHVYRDIMMETSTGEKVVLLAVENQEEIHYSMPVRGMLYDALNYTEQVEQMTKENKDKKRLKGSGEFLSGIRKCDKLAPVITLVFYYGSKKWDGSKDIHGLLDLPQDMYGNWGDLIPNYRINLIDVNELAQNNSFKTDLQWIIGMLQYKDDKKALQKYINEHDDFFRKIDGDTLGAANALLGSRLVPKEDEQEKGEINMCKALDDLYQDGVNEGVSQGLRQGREQGIEQGIEQGERSFGQLCNSLLKTGRIKDLERAATDQVYRKALYQEYRI